MLEMKQEALDRGVATIRKNYEAPVKKGKLTQDKLEQRMALLTTDARLRRSRGRRPRDRGGVRGDGRQGAGVQEARRGDEARRHPGHQHLDARRDRIAAFTKRPQDVVGMHFFSPANVMKLLEVVRGEKTAQGRAGDGDAARPRRSGRPPWSRASATASSATAWSSSTRARPASCSKKAPRRSRSTARSRSSASRWARSAWATSPATTSAGRSASAATSRKPDLRYSRSPTCCARWAASGRRRARAGTTTSPASATRSRRPVVDAMIAEHRAGARHHAAQDQRRGDRAPAGVSRWSTRARASSRRASRSARRDIDIVYLTGYGFPLYRGGPMFYADQLGLPNVVQAMKRFAANPHDDAAFWQPAPLLARAGGRRQDLQLNRRGTLHT